MSAATLDLRSKVRVLLRKSFSSRVLSWKESWMWSRPAVLQGLDARFVQADAGGDEVGVEAEFVGFGDDDFEVVAGKGFAA